MLANQLAFKYAQAIYELANEQGVAQQVAEQLQLVHTGIAEHPDLSMLMYNPRVPNAAKKDTLLKIFGDDLGSTLRNFLLLLIDKRRETILPVIVSEYRQLLNEATGVLEAQVTTAKPLSDGQNQALAQKLSAITKKNVILKPRIDERIIGGVIIRIGDKLIDGSVVRQLNALKAMLLKTEVTKIGVTSGV